MLATTHGSIMGALIPVCQESYIVFCFRGFEFGKFFCIKSEHEEIENRVSKLLSSNQFRSFVK